MITTLSRLVWKPFKNYFRPRVKLLLEQWFPQMASEIVWKKNRSFSNIREQPLQVIFKKIIVKCLENALQHNWDFSESGEMLNEIFGAEDNLLLESDFDVPTFRSLGEEDLSIRSASRRSSDLFIIEGTLSGNYYCEAR